MGRKNRYLEEIQPQLSRITELCSTMTERQVANELRIAVSTWENYKNKYPELVEAIAKGKAKSKEKRIEKYKSLLEKRAEGFHYTETKKVIRSVDGVKTQVIEEYEKYSPPDVGALHLLLKNLDDDWRNDDKATISLKEQRLELEKLKTEMANWV